MNLFVQGMRRSGTTIVYDALLEDPGLHVYYEPFREDTVTEGGGSGAHEGDAFAETRALREEFRRANHPDLAQEDFNWGGPRDPKLEVGTELPGHCRGFLRFLLDQDTGERSKAIKFTRMYAKVGDLHAADPGAVLAHVVRDPRSVAVSMMRGKAAKRHEAYEDPDALFGEREKRKLWSSRGISRELRSAVEFAHIQKPANFMRILMVWKYAFDRTYEEGRRLYGDRYVLLRNEDLRADPAGALRPVYEALGREVPAEVTDWAADEVKPPEEPLHADDERWFGAFALLRMDESLRNAGYPELAERIPESAAPSRLSGVLRRARARLAGRA